MQTYAAFHQVAPELAGLLGLIILLGHGLLYVMLLRELEQCAGTLMHHCGWSNLIEDSGLRLHEFKL